MVLKSVLTASCLALAIGATSAAAVGAGDPQAAPPAEAQTKSSQPDTSRRVCRNLTPSGSRMTRRTCRTQAEWNASADKASDSLLEYQMENATQYQRGAGPL